MDVEKIGKFILEDSSKNEYPLTYGTNLIYIIDGKVIVGGDIINADVSFIINFNNERIQIRKDKGVLMIKNQEIDSESLYDNTKILAGDVLLEFRFIYFDSTLETIIDLYMDGNLELPLNMDRLFLEYAKELKITDETAISNVMAVIDIPEIDNI